MKQARDRELVLPAFRFDAVDHVYTALDTGEQLPHITAMLARTGWVNDTWFTEESAERGTAVHHMTADYDHGALDVKTCVSPFRGFLLAYVDVTGMLRPTWEGIEVPLVHWGYRFGGRPDRVGLAYNCLTIGELKTGEPQRADMIQTALQAILKAGQGGLPAEHWERLAIYLRASGKFKVERHHDRRDFDEAKRIIRVCC